MSRRHVVSSGGRVILTRSRRWPWVVVTAVALGLLGLLHSPLLAVETIEIVGSNRAEVAEAVAETGLGPGAFLLWVNTGDVEHAVAADPWVRDVRVDRLWPDRVVVEVIEHDPLVWIEGTMRWMLVARDGTVVSNAVEPGQGLLRAALAFPDRMPGELPSDPAWHEIVEMALVLADDIGGTLTLEMRGAELWTEALGHEVRLGNPIDLADKGRSLRAMLAGDVAPGAIIDVSSPRRPATVPAESQLGVETEESGT